MSGFIPIIAGKRRRRWKKTITNTIGTPGTLGFGVGLYPSALPEGWTELPGTRDPESEDYGNYLYRGMSTFVWIPAFYYRYGHPDNPTYADYGVNSVEIRPENAFADRAAGAAAGFTLHRMFIDGGEVKRGVMVGKYMASKAPLGTGYVAASVKGGLPISMHADHNPIAELTACGSNYYYQAINACRAIDGENGLVNPNSQFFAVSRYIRAGLALLSLAHGQAATSDAACAWYDPAGVTNYPKGNNNSALRDVDDSTVVYESDGYSNCGKTGSASNLAKTTHNGQASGVADLNGNIFEINIGITCFATTKNITSATQSNPCQLTVPGHGLTGGETVMIRSVEGMTVLNYRMFTISVVDPDTITLDGVDATGFAAYTSGGTVTYGTFYQAKESARMADFTSGTSNETDHWNPASPLLEPVQVPFRTDYPDNSTTRMWGDGNNQVIDNLDLGLPKAVSSGGTNLFGKDYYYMYIRNQLCATAGGSWSGGPTAGAWGLSLSDYRSSSYYAVSFRPACVL